MFQVMTNEAPANTRLMSQGIAASGLLFCASIPRDPQTQAIPETFEAQVRLTMENLRAILRAAGLELSALVKVTVYLADIGDWAQMNEIYSEYVSTTRPPARVTVEIARLNNDYMIEVDTISEMQDHLS